MIVYTSEMRKLCLVITQKIPLCLPSDLTGAISLNKFVNNFYWKHSVVKLDLK